jgi:hypothetical protein
MKNNFRLNFLKAKHLKKFWTYSLYFLQKKEIKGLEGTYVKVTFASAKTIAKFIF